MAYDIFIKNMKKGRQYYHHNDLGPYSSEESLQMALSAIAQWLMALSFSGQQRSLKFLASGPAVGTSSLHFRWNKNNEIMVWLLLCSDGF